MNDEMSSIERVGGRNIIQSRRNANHHRMANRQAERTAH